MASGSLRKKSNKRSDMKPHIPTLSAKTPPSKHRTIHILVTVVIVVCVLALFLGVSFNIWSVVESNPRSYRIYSVQVVNKFPHDPAAFTQGLLYAGNDTLFESTGLNGRSSVRKVALQTGKIEAMHKMDNSYFGEGLTLIGERLFQVTWLKNTGFMYDRNNLSKFEKFAHQMQDGWGLATDEKVLFGSDGTSTLYHIDSQTLKVLQKHTVKYKDHEVHNLNELEYVNDEIWANVWQTDCIAIISQKDGLVLGWVLLHNLRKAMAKAL
ncbi:glutaminyl-peptide cyclotransferase isoform X2 [Diospyros lotus]|uniref:glutaminyl-peptide cyclotransferase isoform X2 n=1 Tax=Diospyros lotus TaxID=55363 RepID=UPI002259665D|nr:glutaminyl-peptide cyclotransferase isoform X2 [Diospyros lotus]